MCIWQCVNVLVIIIGMFFSITETETSWSEFDDDRKNLDAKLTTVERELSRVNVDEMSFKQKKDTLSRLKVTEHIRAVLSARTREEWGWGGGRMLWGRGQRCHMSYKNTVSPS